MSHTCETNAISNLILKRYAGMRKIGVLLVIAALFLLCPVNTNAQIRLSLNLGSQPEWGPTSYDHVEYYYLPEAGIYYYVPGAQFVYRSGTRWIFSKNLPPQYRHINLYNTYKVVVNEPRPYLRHNYYVSHYGQYKNQHSGQMNLRDNRNRGNQMGNNHQDMQRNRMDKNHQDMQRNHMEMGPQKNHDNGNRDNNGNRGNKENKGNDRKDNKENRDDHR
jgi:hypothetical protein